MYIFENSGNGELYIIVVCGINSLNIKFNRVFSLYPVRMNGYYVVSKESLGISCFAKGKDKLLLELDAQMAMLWNEYALCSDDGLDDKAKSIKYRLLSMKKDCVDDNNFYVDAG